MLEKVYWVAAKTTWAIGYVKARLAERSTWCAVGAGATGASALHAPWSAVFVAAAVIGALIPTGGQPPHPPQPPQPPKA